MGIGCYAGFRIHREQTVTACGSFEKQGIPCDGRSPSGSIGTDANAIEDLLERPRDTAAVEDLPESFREAYPRADWGVHVARLLDSVSLVGDLIGGSPIIERRARALVAARRRRQTRM